MTGRWIAVQVTLSEALGAEQKTTNWFWMDIEQSGETFTVVDSLNCGFRVTGTTTVTISDDTTEALALRTSSSVGRQGTMRDVGSECEFSMNRTYNLRGATRSTFLDDHWTIGDPDKPLDEFPQLPADMASGMEDWDGDGMDAITFDTGLGPRYAAQRDWNEHAGNVPKNADQFGGDGIVVATWDSQEAISDQTSLLLRSSATPINPGFAHYARVGSALEIIDGDVLETCKNVQRAALEIWPNP